MLVECSSLYLFYFSFSIYGYDDVDDDENTDFGDDEDDNTDDCNVEVDDCND